MATKSTKKASVFILDDDQFFLEMMKETISKQIPSLSVSVFNKKDEFLENMTQKPDLVLLDYNLGIENDLPINAHSVLVTINQMNPLQKVILISDENTAGLLQEYQQFRDLSYIVKSQTVPSEITNIIYHSL